MADEEKDVLLTVSMVDFLRATQSVHEPILVNDGLNRYRGIIPRALRKALGSIAILPIVVDSNLSYIFSLIYLAVAASAITFVCYLILIREIGSTRTAYTSLLFPIVALIISTMAGEYSWSLYSLIGVIFIFFGTWLALPKITK